MKLTPFQLMALAVGGFATIVLMDVLAKYRSNENFRDYLTDLKASDLIPDIRLKRVAEENMETVAAAVEDSDGEDDDDD